MNFDLLRSNILVQMFQPSVAGSDKLQYDHTVRKLVSTIFLQLCRSLPAKSSSVFQYVKETACTLNKTGSKYCFVLSLKKSMLFMLFELLYNFLQALHLNSWNQMPFTFHTENLFPYQ